MSSEAGKQIYKQRAATSETVNADLRSYRGLGQITVRGLAKAQCVALWCPWRTTSCILPPRCWPEAARRWKTPNPAMKFAPRGAVERDTVTPAGDWQRKARPAAALKIEPRLSHNL